MSSSTTATAFKAMIYAAALTGAGHAPSQPILIVRTAETESPQTHQGKLLKGTIPPSKVGSITSLKNPYAVEKSHFTTLKDRMLNQLDTYATGHRLADISISTNPGDIETAKRFLYALPSGIPLPNIMRNDDGEIGLYWDDGDVYADVNVDTGGTVSLFTKVRSTGDEDFFDDIDVNLITPSWAYHHLSLLNPNLSNAA